MSRDDLVDICGAFAFVCIGLASLALVVLAVVACL